MDLKTIAYKKEMEIVDLQMKLNYDLISEKDIHILKQKSAVDYSSTLDLQKGIVEAAKDFLKRDSKNMTW